MWQHPSQQVDSSTKLKPPAAGQEDGRMMRVFAKVANQKWLTVGAILFVAGAGLLAADATAELLVGRFQRLDDDDD